ncbi:MAG: tetratricopeptide repeat protein, partial [Thermoanaerobaculia bacterium]
QVQLGNCALAAAELPAAVTAYRAAVALDAAQPIAWNNLGVALERAGDGAAALTAYRRAAQLDPAYPLDRGALGRLGGP